MIKLIIFDLSGVCFNNEEDPYLEEFAKKHDIDLTELREIYFKELDKAERNLSTCEKVWQIVLDKYSIDDDPERLIADMMKDKEAFQPMLDLAASLRTKVKTAYLTNYCEAYWKHIEERFQMQKYFDYGLVAYQIGVRKPAPKGFELIMQHFNAKPEETIFLDDSEKNLEKVKELGMNTIHFKGEEQLLQSLKDAGIELD
jgi:HAD superfamily hydrolase (TIGR01509 family)